MTTTPQPAQLRKTPVAEQRAPEPEAATADVAPTVRAWAIVWVSFAPDPGGGYELREMHIPMEAVDAYTKRRWAPDLMSVVASRLSSRVHATVTDLASADKDTY